MASAKLSKRVSTALLNALASGVVPRLGLDRIAVGRESEVGALGQDLSNAADGGASFRFVVGRYGSGKSFLLQLLRNQAMEQGFIVADADLSPERRLAGGNGFSVATYRELMRNLATKIRPDGGALAPLLERWIAGIQSQVAEESNLKPNDEGFDDRVEAKIRAVVKDVEELVNGFEFASVLTAYWNGYRNDDSDLQESALRWLRGEFSTKTEARAALGVRAIVSDDDWFDYVKLFARFAADIGYQGMVVFLDEAVHLYKITNAVSRQNNYDKLLAMFNDTMQGRVGHLSILIGGTPQLIEDSRRGLCSDPAWQRRTAGSRFVKAGLQDMTGPVMRLEPLSENEIRTLLQRLVAIHATHYNYKPAFKASELEEFLSAIAGRLGADVLLTPGEIVREFIAVLNALHQNPKLSLSQLVRGDQPAATKKATSRKSQADEENQYAEFTL